MKNPRYVFLGLLVTVSILFAALLFWPVLLDNIIKPVAMVVWLLLRLLVLSIDQKYLWYAAALVAIILVFRLLPQEQLPNESDAYPGTNSTINNIGYWRMLLTYKDQNIRDEKTLKRELLYLLTSLYASKQSSSKPIGVYSAMQQGEIPLPGHVHELLFAEEPQAPAGVINRFILSTRKAFRKWIRQWTGQEKAEHYQLVDEVLSFLETSLETQQHD